MRAAKYDTRLAVLRIVDANLNRLKEALRVVEEVARLGRDERLATSRLKTFRHEVERLSRIARFSRQELLGARDSQQDVGKSSRLRDGKKVRLNDLLTSNFKRAEEAARVLEEFSKLFSETASKGFQRLRFELYTLEKELLA